MLSLLIFSFDDIFSESLDSFLSNYNYKISSSNSYQDCIDSLLYSDHDVLILDSGNKHTDSLNFIKELKIRFKKLNIVYILNEPALDSAVQALKSGVIDVFYKPLNLFNLLYLLDSFERKSSEFSNEPDVFKTARDKLTLSQIAGNTNKLKSVIRKIRTYANTDVNILITGPSGSGKGVLARAIHAESNRKQFPFIEINCSAIPNYLFETELFGHEKGAFTDAFQSQKGLIEAAHKGTLFFDEIADVPVELQSKLLKVIEDKAFYRIGGTERVSVAVRFIAATNRNIHDWINKGLFREDLYYRLALVSVDLPPLKNRKPDIIHIAEKFIQSFAYKLEKDIRGMTPQVKNALLRYEWKGNIRELRNVIERMVIISQSKYITESELPPELGGESSNIPDQNSFITLKDLKKKYILATLESVDGNRIKAARILGIPRSTLYDKLKQYQSNSDSNDNNNN